MWHAALLLPSSGCRPLLLILRLFDTATVSVILEWWMYSMRVNVSVSEMALNRVIMSINMPCHVQEPVHHWLRHSTRKSYINIMHRLQKLKQRERNVRHRRRRRPDWWWLHSGSHRTLVQKTINHKSIHAYRWRHTCRNVGMRVCAHWHYEIETSRGI